uniref:Uncharacterized protein n=1 Tax=Lepeophtheirus salmonis TaxID=72036 RepID=A0A0K2VIJ1_LEPSM
MEGILLLLSYIFVVNFYRCIPALRN